MQLSACIEWLFADEADDIGARIHAAKAAGLDAVEFWLWRNKALDAIEMALKETGVSLSGFVAEPMIALTDPANHAAFLEGLKRSIEVAQRLGAKVLIAQAGDDLPGKTRAEQREALTSCLAASADVLKGSGIRLGVEPLNTLIDHQGYFLSSTAEALDIVDEVARPEIGIVYDLYHSLVMGEVPQEVASGRVDRIIHVHNLSLRVGGQSCAEVSEYADSLHGGWRLKAGSAAGGSPPPGLGQDQLPALRTPPRGSCNAQPKS